MSILKTICPLIAATCCLCPAAETEPDRSAETFFKPPYRLHKLEAVQPSDVELVMSLSEEQIRAAMPVQTPRIHTGCPNCHAHKEQRNWMDHGERGQLRHIWFWDFDPLKPDTITCKICGESYPDNPKFPQDQTQEYTNPVGETFEVRSYLDPGQEDETKRKHARRYYLDGSLDTARWYWMRQQMVNLARLYVVTGEERYAGKSLEIFNAYLDRFPHFLMCSGYGRNYTNRKNDNDAWRAWGRSTRSHRRSSGDGEGIHLDPVRHMLADSQAMKESGKKFGKNLIQKYQDNVRAYLGPWRCPPERIGKPPYEKKAPVDRKMHVGQQSAPSISADWRENRDYGNIRHTIRNYEVFPFITYGVDGSFFEGLGYGSIQYLANMQMVGINGYSDPPDYDIPEGEKRYLNYHYPRNEYEDFYRDLYSLPERLRLPHGYQVTLNDGGQGYTSATFLNRDPRKSSESLNLPGMKHVMLGDGHGDEQVQVHIGFGHATHHSHADTLGIQLWAHGHYLIDDISYPKHKLRSAYSGVQMHNTVVIDGRGQPVRLGDGDVALYAPNLPGVQVVKVDAPRANVGYADVYSRLLALITVDSAHPYVIDVFHVKGGAKKDYMLRAPQKHEVETTYSIPLEEMPGDYALTDTVPNRHYSIFSHVRKGDASKGFTLTYDQTDPWPKDEDGLSGKYPMRATPDSWKDEPAIGTKHHVMGGAGMTAYATGIPQNSECTGEKPWKDCKQWPFLVLRHEGEESVFAVVHEPYAGKAAIESVTLAKPFEPGDTHLVLTIKTRDRTDTALVALGNEPVKATLAGESMDARFGFVSKTAKRTDTVAIGGPDREFSGTVARSLRTWDMPTPEAGGDDVNGFLLEGENLPPAGTALRGEWIMLSNHGELRTVPDLVGIGRQAFRTSDRNKTFDDPVQAASRDWFFNEAGIGVCAEIDRVEVRDGKTYLITRKDHGIHVKEGYMKELYRPQREVFGAPTSFTIITGAGSMGRKPIPTYDIPVVASLAPAPIDRAELKPGLVREELILRTVDEATHAKLKAEGRIKLPGRHMDKVFDSMFRIIYPEPFYFVDEYLASVETADLPDVRSFVQKYPFNGNYFGRVRYTAYLDVPADGVYTFHFRPFHDGTLSIGGRLISDYSGYVGEPVARVYRVEMKKGLHALEFDDQVKPAHFGRWPALSEFEWEGPGFKRRALRESDLLHDPAMVARLKGTVQPLQPRRGPPPVEYAGRPIFATREEALEISIERNYIGVESNEGKDVPQF